MYTMNDDRTWHQVGSEYVKTYIIPLRVHTYALVLLVFFRFVQAESASKPVCCITLEPVSLTLRRSVLGSRVSDTKLVPGDTGYPCTKSAVLI